jgi:aminopeptidase YwaD
MMTAACDSTSTPPRSEPSRPAASAPTSASTPSPPAGSTATAPSPQTSPPESASAAPRTIRASATRATVELLAGRIGPRESTTPAYRRAARWVEQRLSTYGYDVRRQLLQVPKGVSWGVPVPAGPTWNVVARPTTLRDGERYLVVGAQLDTVPQAPGAEDNASGVAVLLELARLAAAGETRLPVVFVAFAGEEPRGPGDDQHHFGSTAMVARLSENGRRALRGMVSVDRVGVGRVVPICTGGLGSRDVQQQLERAARRLEIAFRSCQDNRSSDHWSVEKAGLAAARVGSTPYAQYHSAADLPGVVKTAQLRRAGRVTWQWLSQ